MSATEADKASVIQQEKQEKPVRKRRRVYGEKVCQVCGDKALAHHFGTLACETCKAFFRRNALSKEPRKCLFKGECPIDVKTRRFCPACRLAKCFSVGMQADLILDEEEKKQRILKMSEKKSRKEQSSISSESDEKSSVFSRHSPNCGVTTTSGEVALSADHTASMVEQAWLAASSDGGGGAVGLQAVRSQGPLLVDSQWSPEAAHSMEPILSTSHPSGMGHTSNFSLFGSSRESDMPKLSADFASNHSISTTPATPASAVSCDPEAWQSSAASSGLMTPQPPHHSKDRTCSPSVPLTDPSITTSFKHVSHEELPSDPHMYWRLSEEERSLLTQLSSAYQDTLLSLLQRGPPREEVQHWTLDIYLQEFELEVGHAVNFAKRMEDFRQLRLDEQIALLKASTCQVLGVRSWALYIMEKDAWLTQNGYLTQAKTEELFPNHPQMDDGVLLCQTMKSIVKNDVTLYALLHCVALFDPSEERIIDRQLINSIRDKYIILLRHYLESVYSYLHSEKYMIALQQNLAALKVLTREGKPLIKKFFPSIPNKLLIEILDLDS
ncbi:nuclear hormone receptor family member nhr-8-like [Babylonia areolata]|uniref:nuclear hormone receptor family member nhr-8-like n=1 Tax=Babylonia areolata TaxID=304850 RepID=UPI003FD32417